MQAIKSKGTKDENLLAETLWHRGHRYRKNNKSVYGKPDLTFKKNKIAIFIDSEYFHGKDWHIEKHRIKTNRNFWWTKIEGNMKRDESVNEHLINNGRKVLRFWSKEIRKNLANRISLIEQQLKDSNGKIQQHKKETSNRGVQDD